MPRQQLNETSVQKKVTGACHVMNGGVLPVTGFPRVRSMETSVKTDTVQTKGCVSYNTSIRSRTYLGGYTFVACKRDGSCSMPSRGSRRSRDVCRGSSRTTFVVKVVELDVIHAIGACSGIGLEEDVLGESA